MYTVQEIHLVYSVKDVKNKASKNFKIKNLEASKLETQHVKLQFFNLGSFCEAFSSMIQYDRLFLVI